jgi:hypothetical protein
LPALARLLGMEQARFGLDINIALSGCTGALRFRALRLTSVVLNISKFYER